MKAFVPGVSDAALAAQLYEASRKLCELEVAYRVSPKKVLSLRYDHDGREFFAKVGGEDPDEGKIYFIHESDGPYFVCTANRGVLRGLPLLVGREEVLNVEYFDEK